MGSLEKTSDQKNSDCLSSLAIPGAMTKELKTSNLLQVSPLTHVESSKIEQHLVPTYENAFFFFICHCMAKIVSACDGQITWLLEPAVTSRLPLWLEF